MANSRTDRLASNKLRVTLCQANNSTRDNFWYYYVCYYLITADDSRHSDKTKPHQINCAK